MAGDKRTERKDSAFDYWLRTGRRLPEQNQRAPIEYKFNGWHDPGDGKFTFKGAGTYYGSGSSAGETRGFAMARPPKPSPKRGAGGDGTWQGGGFTGGGGGSGGGGGASGPGYYTLEERRARERQSSSAGPVIEGTATSARSKPQARSPSGAPVPGPSKTKPQSEYTVRQGDTLSSIAERERVTVEQLASANSMSNPDRIVLGQRLVVPASAGSKPGWVSIQSNRLTFEIDQIGLTRVARGTLARGDANDRSRTLQANAGKPDRQPKDDGGHIIAPRFGGPKATYNHFAQDANFNRGAYRALEDTWANAQREGKQVSVRVNLIYSGQSRRPDGLEVESNIADRRRRTEFGNRAGGRHE